MESKSLLLVDKPYGWTPLECIDRLRELGKIEKDEKATYAGRLDPLATGLLLILKGDGVHEKDRFIGLDKTYAVELTFGAYTDTGDVLGVLESVQLGIEAPRHADFINVLSSVTQAPYPRFSSRTVDGVALHESARAGESIDRPLRAMSYSISDLEDVSSISFSDLRDMSLRACDLVKGDFRQEQIRDSWNGIQEDFPLPRFSFVIDAFSGTYIRSIPEIIMSEFGIPSVVTKIHRTRVGDIRLDGESVISL